MTEDIRHDEALVLRAGQGPSDYVKLLEAENARLREALKQACLYLDMGGSPDMAHRTIQRALEE